MELRVRVHHEDGSYWAEAVELPGCFASGDTLDELADALDESVRLYLSEQGSPQPVGPIEIAEMKVATAAVTQSA